MLDIENIVSIKFNDIDLKIDNIGDLEIKTYIDKYQVLLLPNTLHVFKSDLPENSYIMQIFKNGRLYAVAVCTNEYMRNNYEFNVLTDVEDCVINLV